MVFSILRRLIGRDDAAGEVRRVAGGRITLVGFPPSFRETSFLRGRRPQLVPIEAAVATPMRPADIRDRASFAGGGIYDARGRRVEAARREITRGVPPMRVRRSVRLDRLSPADVVGVAGTEMVYAGPALAHFGHFLLEVLSRLWWVGKLDPAGVRLVFHEAGPRGRRDAFLAKPYVGETLALLGLDAERAVFVADAPLRFPRLLVPAPVLSLGGHAYTGFPTAYERLAAAADPDGEPPSRALYFSRTRIRDDRQRIANEAEVEALMRALGVEVAYPEELPFAAQIRLVRRARLLVGCAGSALHLAAFARPATRVLCLDSWHNTNQLLVEHAKGLVARHLWFGSDGTHVRREDDPVRSVDLDRVRTHTLAMLND